MNVGGNSFSNGIQFVANNYSVKFILDNNGNCKITSKKHIETGRFKKVPILRGLSALFFQNGLIGVSLIIMIFLEIYSIFDEQSYSSPAVSIIMLILLMILFIYVCKKMLVNINDTWRYHGAEHKTIYAHTHNMDLTLENIRKSPRTAKRCGTNLAVFIVVIYVVLSVFIHNYVMLKFVVSYLVAYEIFDIDKGDKLPVIKWFYKLGYWCQQHLFTKEPSDAQILESIKAMNMLVELESV